LEKGVRKRGKEEDVQVYRRAKKREWAEMAAEMAAVCFGGVDELPGGVAGIDDQ
jgi:hypothetical protein